MELSELIVDTKEAWIDYPGYDGFKVKVAGLSRPQWQALRNRCIETKFDRSTRQATEKLNEKKFIAEFTDATIKDWSGLKLEYLESLLLVDISGKDPNEELRFSKKDAELLISRSSEFDTWVNEVVFDLENFRTGTKGSDVEAPGEVAE